MQQITTMWKNSSEGSDRLEYLQNLVTEFQDTDNEGEIDICMYC